MYIKNKQALVISIFLAVFFISCAQAGKIPVPDVKVSANGQHIVINIPQTRLFLFKDGELINSYPVAVGKAKTHTPIGEYTFRGAAYNPVWNVPLSIQKEMQRTGKTVVKSVPAGAKNPLGPVFMRMGDPKLGLGIHGTNAPSSVPGIRSHGCVRMKSHDALSMAKILHIGIPISVIYQPVILSKDDAGQLWITVYRDVYNEKNINNELLAKTLLDWENDNKTLIDGKLLNKLMREHRGKTTCLSCSDKKPKVNGDLSQVKWLDSSVSAAAVITKEKTPLAPEASSAPMSE